MCSHGIILTFFLIWECLLIVKVGLGISRKNADSQWNPICGQRSSRAAESKRRVIGNYFPSEFVICS